MRLAALLLFAPLFGIAAEDDAELFEKRVRPLLAARCYGCHAAEKQFGGLRVDGRDRLIRGGQNGAAIVPEHPEQGSLLAAVRSGRMPMGGAKLTAPEVAALEDWIRKGAVWPNAEKSAASVGDPGFYEKLKREHWAFQPVRGGNKSIDALTGKAGAPAAEPYILARRVANVLTGLPPKPSDLRNFNYEAYVDRLLASPQFGERWARHWMDVVRYAETYGYEWNFEIKSAWRYRDYLIRAFNSDVPYDQLIREHIAGDLLPNPRTRDNGRFNESVVGTTFYRLGEMGHDDCIQFRELRTDVVDNQIDTLTKAFQGMTVSCARCHDHKIDPIPTEDYYALYGILNSSRPVTATLNRKAPDTARLAVLKPRIRQALAAAWLADTAKLDVELKLAQAWRRDGTGAANAGVDAHRVQAWVKLLDRKKVDLDDPLYPVMQTAATWDAYQKEIEVRDKFNAEKFAPVADFAKSIPSGWTVDGLGLRNATPAPSGDFAVATEGHQAVAGIFPAGIYTNLLSDRMNGVLRSPLLGKKKKYLSLEMVGGNAGAQRTIVDHCVIGEDHQIVETAAPRWFTTPTKADSTLPVYLELDTKSDNPRLPERVGRFKDFNDDSIRGPRSFFGVTRAYYHDEKITPKSTLSHMRRMFNGKPMEDGFAEAVRNVIAAWRDNKATDDDVQWLNWLLREGVLVNSRNLTPQLRELSEAYRAAEAGLEEPQVAYSMGDFDPGADQPIFLAGAALSPGRPAPRHFLSLLPENLRRVGTAQSGRRELAEAIADPGNPLTARVMVNRIWHYVFGKGIVATTDNFGRYGEKPENQELLDTLAAKFVANGWSMKKLIREMVLSQTFRAADAPVRRLDAESVRDAILAVSGRLDLKMYGESIQPRRLEPQDYRRLFQGPLDGDGRRSIYLKVTRMEGPRFLEIFDMPPPLQTRGNRDVTNVPSQALALLNDPFVTAQAAFWAERLLREDETATVDTRLRKMFQEALSREPSDAELQRWRELAQKLPWKDVAHTFFNTKEFLYLR